MVRELLQGVTGYPGLFLICALSGVIIPVPEDIPLLYAGVNLQAGVNAWLPTLAVAIAGVWTRDVLVFLGGRLAGEALLQRAWVLRTFGAARISRARRLVDERGVWAVMIGRFLVGARAPVFMVAGAMGVGFRKFALWDAVGCILAVPLAVFLGYFFGEPLLESAEWLFTHQPKVLAGLLFLGLVGGYVWLRRERMQHRIEELTQRRD